MNNKSETNISEGHQKAFDALRDPQYTNFALMSCFLDGKPTCCIVAVHDRGEFTDLAPLFVAVTPDMVLTDHEGVAPRWEETDDEES